jgi:flavin-dependent dehydrogenase
MPRAIVVGAGPAGSSAAVLLARGGWTVTLVEHSRFPRDKVCGECLSALGVGVLTRLGLMPALLDSGAILLRRAVLHSSDGASLHVALPSAMLGVSRALLDSVLLRSASDAGATVMQPARCERILPGSRPVVRLRDLLTNRTSEIEADVVLLADGKSALLGSKPPATNDLGLKTHFTLDESANDTTRDTIELFGFDGCYGGLAPIEGARRNLAISIPAARMRALRGDGDAVLRELLACCPALRERLRGARRVGEWLASPLPRFAVVRDWPAGVIPIGNAAAAIEPIGGEGMGLALRSAELAARWLLDASETPWSDAGALRVEFVRLWRRRALVCRVAARVLSRRWVAGGALRVASRSPAVLGLFVDWMGKRGAA